MPLPNVDPGTYLVIRTDGSEETRTWPGPGTGSKTRILAMAIHAETLDFVSIGRGERSDLVMAVNDRGYEFEVVEHAPNHYEHAPTKALHPVNEKATAFYHAICHPGTTHQIVGDVAICHDGDFA